MGRKKHATDTEVSNEVVEPPPPAVEPASDDSAPVAEGAVEPSSSSAGSLDDAQSQLAPPALNETTEPAIQPRKSRRRKGLSNEAQALADALPDEALSESAGGQQPDEPDPLPQEPASTPELGEPLVAETDPLASRDADQVTPDANEPAELKLIPAEDDVDGDASESTGEAASDEPQFIDPNAPEITTQQVVEAILFVSDTPLTLPKIVSLLGVGSARDVKKHIELLNERYIREGATFRIDKIAGGYQMLTLPQYNTWLRRLRQSRQDSRFSAAALETLAVVAYKQPVTRADVEAIRGVAAGEMLNRLRELNLVKIVGRAEDVGRPMLYGTTKRFLEVFGLASLEELPQVEQLQIAQ